MYQLNIYDQARFKSPYRQKQIKPLAQHQGYRILFTNLNLNILLLNPLHRVWGKGDGVDKIKMQTEKGVSVLAEDCQKALKSVLQQISMLNQGDQNDVKDDVRLLEGLIDKDEELSVCCGAPLDISKAFCSDCGEHV